MTLTKDSDKNLAQEYEPLLWMVGFIWIVVMLITIILFIFQYDIMIANKAMLQLLPVTIAIGGFPIGGLLVARGIIK